MIQPMPKYKIDDVVRYWDDKRKGIKFYGQVKEIRVRADSIQYVMQDHQIADEKKVEACYCEIPF